MNRLPPSSVNDWKVYIPAVLILISPVYWWLACVAVKALGRLICVTVCTPVGFTPFALVWPGVVPWMIGDVAPRKLVSARLDSVVPLTKLLSITPADAAVT